MPAFTTVVYPVLLIASLALAVLGGLTIAAPRLHRVLKAVHVAYRVLIFLECAVIAWAIIAGDTPVLMTAMYIGAILATLLLLGIGRLGTPEAAQKNPEAGRPILSPAQVAKVDGGAAVLVAVAQAVLTWRVHEIMLAAA